MIETEYFYLSAMLTGTVPDTGVNKSVFPDTGVKKSLPAVHSQAKNQQLLIFVSYLNSDSAVLTS